MAESNARSGKLAEIFEQGRSELLNRVAQISVLYEDLRLEVTVLTGYVQLHTSAADIHNPFEIFYFLRRSLITLIEYSGALNQLTSQKTFEQHLISDKDAGYIQDANRYFQANHKKLKRLRNEFGGHFQLSYARGATANFEPGEQGRVLWEGDRDVFSLKLEFAASIITAGLRHVNPGQDWLAEYLKAVSIIGRSYTHAQGATYALVHAFLWDRFEDTA